MLELVNRVVLAMLILAGAALAVAALIAKASDRGLLSEQLVPMLIGFGTMGGWVGTASALFVFVVAIVLVAFHVVRGRGAERFAAVSN